MTVRAMKSYGAQMEFSFTEWPEQEITPEDIIDAAFLDGYEAALKQIEDILINTTYSGVEVMAYIREYRDMQ